MQRRLVLPVSMLTVLALPIIAYGQQVLSLGAPLAITNNNGSIHVNVPITNTSTTPVDVLVTGGILGDVGTSSALPLKLGTLRPRQSYQVILAFPSSKLASGLKTAIVVQAKYTQGSQTRGLGVTQPVMIPQAAPGSVQEYLFTNPSEPGILEVHDPSGSVYTYSGTKDSSGAATSVTGVKQITPDGQPISYQFDAHGRVTSAEVLNGAKFIFHWKSNTLLDLDAYSADRKAHAATQIDFSKGTYTSFPLNMNALNREVQTFTASPASASLTSQANTAGTTGVAQAHITSCGQPEDNADASIEASWSVGASASEVAEHLPSDQPGYYDASIPVPDPGAATNIANQIEQATRSMDPICNAQSFVNPNEPPKGNELLVCGAVAATLVVVTDGIASIEAPTVFEACLKTWKTVEYSCSAREHAGSIAGAIDIIRSAQKVTLQTFATLDGVMLAGDISPSVSAYGPFPSVGGIDFACNPLKQIVIQPDSLSLKVGDTSRLDATAIDSNGVEITSSKVQLQWQNTDSSVATVDEDGGVTAKSPGTTDAWVVDIGTGISSDRVSIQVSADAPQFNGTYSSSNTLPDGYTHTETDIVSNGAITGSHTFTNGQESGSFNWTGSIASSTDNSAEFVGQGTITDSQYGTRSFTISSGSIVINQDGSAVLTWAAIDPAQSNNTIGWQTFR